MVIINKQLHPRYPLNGMVEQYNDNDDRWCPYCNIELHYRELIGGGYHYWCEAYKCDYERWED